MDSNDLERERGITILAKTTSVEWGETRINIVDTPGHADFGGEVERILGMVDGAIVLVDAAEGPMPQTKFVVGKALKVGLKPIVAVNKIDKPERRPDEVINEVFDLFADLGATDEQLDFPILYGSAKEGWMSAQYENPTTDMNELFDLVVKHVKPPALLIAYSSKKYVSPFKSFKVKSTSFSTIPDDFNTFLVAFAKPIPSLGFSLYSELVSSNIFWFVISKFA